MVRKTRRKNVRKMKGGMFNSKSSNKTRKTGRRLTPASEQFNVRPQPPNVKSLNVSRSGPLDLHTTMHAPLFNNYTNSGINDRPHTANPNDHYGTRHRQTPHIPYDIAPFERSPLTQKRNLVDIQELIGVIHQLRSLHIFLEQEISSIESQQENVPDNGESGGDLISLLEEKQRISIEINNITYRLGRLIPDIKKLNI